MEKIHLQLQTYQLTFMSEKILKSIIRYFPQTWLVSKVGIVSHLEQHPTDSLVCSNTLSTHWKFSKVRELVMPFLDGFTGVFGWLESSVFILQKALFIYLAAYFPAVHRDLIIPETSIPLVNVKFGWKEVINQEEQTHGVWLQKPNFLRKLAKK